MYKVDPPLVFSNGLQALVEPTQLNIVDLLCQLWSESFSIPILWSNLACGSQLHCMKGDGACAPIASYPAFTKGRKNAWFQLFAHAQKFPRNLGNCVILVFFRVWITHNHVILVFFRVMATCRDSDNEFSSALVLRVIYTSEGYSNWKPLRWWYTVT